jgi:tape measure domain-containing protein
VANNRINIQITAQDDASAPLRQVGRALDDTSERAGGFRNSLGRIRDVALGVYLPQLAGKFLDLGQAAVRGTADFEQTRIALDTMLGSGEKASALMKEISDFASSTPFEMPEVAKGAKNLLAFGFAQEQVIPTLRQLGDIAAGVNMPMTELAEIYGKARVQGRLFMEDINQLTGRGIPVIQALASTMGVAEADIRKLVEEGKVGFPQLEAAMASMTGEGSKFGGMMEKQSKSLNGQLSTLSDNFASIGRKIVGMDDQGNIKEGGFFSLLRDGAEKLNEKLTDVNENWGKTAEGMTKFEKFAQKTGLSIRSFNPSLTVLANNQELVKDMTEAVNVAQQRAKVSADVLKAAQLDSAAKARELAAAQDAARVALEKYGAKSPEYLAAVDALKQKDSEYIASLQDQTGKMLDNTIKVGQLKQARDLLNDSTKALAASEDILNKGFDGTIQRIATIGPTALNQVASLGRLQDAIGTVAGKWADASYQIDTKSTELVGRILGLGNTMERVSGQSTTIVKNLQQANSLVQNAGNGLQGSTNKPRAIGTNFAPAGDTLVGEHGPERLRLPAGAQIDPAWKTRADSASGAAGATYKTEINGNIILQSADAVSSFFDRIDKTQRMAKLGVAA